MPLFKRKHNETTHLGQENPTSAGYNTADPYTSERVPHNNAGYDGPGTAGLGNAPHHNRFDEGPTGVPPAAVVAGGTGTSSMRGTGGSTTGKIERKVGDLVGSRALREKGLEKEREAQAFKAQSSELAEAERLEQEAMMRRERAVAHGAHPDNKHLGGGRV